jgi:hypothetical protein
MATTYYKGGYMRDDGVFFDNLGNAADEIISVCKIASRPDQVRSAISKAAIHGRHAYGFRWARVEEPMDPDIVFGEEHKREMKGGTTAVMAGPTDGRWWPSIAEAGAAIAAETGLNVAGLRSSIRNCVARGRGTAGGYAWRRCDDPYEDPEVVFGEQTAQTDDNAPEILQPKRWKPGIEVYVRMADRTLARARILRVLHEEGLAQVSIIHYQIPVWQYTEMLVRA